MRGTYFGWYVVFAAFIGFTLIVGLTTGAFGVFVLPVSQELGLSRSQMNMTLIFINMGSALVAPLVGRMLDRVPLRSFMMLAVALLGGSTFLLSIVDTIWLSALILFIPFPIAMQVAGMSSMNVLIARWFKAHLARAMALGLLGMSFGVIVIPPLLSAMVEAWGWREALGYYAIALVAILLPVYLPLRDRPGPGDHEVSGSAEDARQTADPADTAEHVAKPVPVLEILKNPAFWTIAVSFSIAMGVNSACIASLTPLGMEKGLSPVMAATLVSMAGTGSVTGMLLVAGIGDRIGRIPLLTTAYFLMGVACLGLLAGQDQVSLLAASLGLGLTGAGVPAFYALVADRFGANSYGTAQGLMQPLMAMIGAGGMWLAGALYDWTGGYDLMFQAFFAIQVVAATLIWATRFTGRQKG